MQPARRSAPPIAAFVTGLAAEARVAERLGRACAGGGTEAGVEAAAERLASEGARALVSFGLCGGLDPAWRPGALVIPRRVAAGDDLYVADSALAEVLGGFSAEALAAVPAVLASAKAKRTLFEKTGAAAVDLESGAVARVAARHNLPFAVLRAVCDPAEMALPPLALAALDAAGRIGARRIAASLLAAPRQLPALLRLARAAAAARAALVRRVDDILRGDRGGMG